MHYLPQSCRPRMQEQVGWAVLTQALTGCSLLGLDWSSSLLSDGPRPGDPLPRRFSQVASKLELPSWFLFMWALRRAARVSFQYGSWLLSEKMIQKAKAERAMHFITQAWVSHTVTSTIFNGSHQPAEEHSWPGIKTSILCMVQIRKKKKNHCCKPWPLRALREVPAVCMLPTEILLPLASLWQGELCPWILSKPRTLVNSIRTLGNESHPVLVLKSKLFDSSLAKFLPFG